MWTPLFVATLLASLHYARSECTTGSLEVTVTVVDAKVPDADPDFFIFNDETDPYAVVHFGDDGKQYRDQTETLYDTLKPDWNEDLDIGCVPTDLTMKVSVYDWDFGDDELVLYQEWVDWADYKNGVTRRLEDSLTADDDETNYYIDVIVSWTNTTGVGSPPTPNPTPKMVPTVHLTPSPTDVNRFCNEADLVPDCSGDGSCCYAAWIGDGIPDCTSHTYYFYYSFYFCDLSCYDYDGGDCAPTVSPTAYVAPRPTVTPTVPKGSHHHQHDNDSQDAGVAVGISFAVVAGILLIFAAGVYYYRYSDGRALYGKLSGTGIQKRTTQERGAMMQGPSRELSTQSSSYTPPSMKAPAGGTIGSVPGNHFHDDDDQESELIVANPLTLSNGKEEEV